MSVRKCGISLPWIFFMVLFFYGCQPQTRIKKTDIPTVQYQKIYLHPFSDFQVIKKSEFWPQEEIMGSILLEYLQKVWKKIYTEFRLCEKYGLYSMVDSAEVNTIDVFIQFSALNFENDTLYMPIEMRAVQKNTNFSYSLMVPAIGICPPPVDSTTLLTLQRLVALFDDYCRRFPVKKIVLPYYLNNIEE